MANEKVIKVFHAARQDIEIFVKRPARSRTRSSTPRSRPWSAASATGQLRPARLSGDRRPDRQVSRFTDWVARGRCPRSRPHTRSPTSRTSATSTSRSPPSSPSRIAPTGSTRRWRCLPTSRPIAHEPEDAWQRLKLRVSKPRELAVLQALAAWREREAQAATCRAAASSRTTRSTRSRCSSRATPRRSAGCAPFPKGFERSRAARAISRDGRSVLDDAGERAAAPAAPAPAPEHARRRGRAPQGAAEDGRARNTASPRASSRRTDDLERSPPTTTPTCRRSRAGAASCSASRRWR